MLQRLLTRWAAIVFRHHVLVLVVLTIVTLLSSLAFTQLQLQVDVQAMLPDGSRAVQANFELKESFGAEFVVVVLQDDLGPILQHADFVDILADLLAESALIEQVDSSVYQNVPTGLMLRWLPLLLNREEMEGLAGKVSSQNIAAQIRRDKIELQSPMVPPRLKRLIKEDPLLLVRLLENRLVASRGGYSLNTSSGHYVSRDDSTLLMFAKPTGASDDIPFTKELALELDAVFAAALAEYRDELQLGADAEVPGLTIGVTGMHAISARESEVLQRDGVRAVGWSLVLVLLLFWVTFRRLDAVLFVGIPLVAGLLWTLGLSTLVIGHLNLLSTGFAAIVLGLGVDYAIHIYNRYLDHRSDGDGPERSIEAAVAETGTGVIIGGVTTSGAFFALLLYDFRGLREFGFIVGTGVLLTLLAMVTWLPALLAFRERRTGKPFHSRTLLPFGTRALAASVAARPMPYLIISIVVTGVLGVAATNVGWQGRVLGNDFSANPALQLREELRSRFQSSPDAVRLILRGDDLEELERVGRLAYDALAPLTGTGRIGDLDSIFRYLQPPDVQQETMRLLRDDPRYQAERVEADLRRALEDQGFRTRPFEPAISALRESFQPSRRLGLEAILDSGGESPFLTRYITKTSHGHTLAMTLSSGRQGFRKEDIDAIEARLISEVPGFNADEGAAPIVSFLAGGKILGRELRAVMKEGYALVTGAALLLVLGMLVLSFRRPVRILLALVPLVLGVTWMLGIMTLAGIDMNVINVPVTAMILGIGIDDAVHVLHSFFTDAGRDVRRTYRTTGKALVLTTLTTTAGFGSLAVAGHPGLRSMGVLAILGCFCCLIATLTTLPAILSYLPPKDDADAD
jgi:predicted RND superfamily exporter protein